MFNREYLIGLSAVSMVILTAGGAYAQQSTAIASSADTSSPIGSPTNSSQSDQLAEVIVTSQRRAERLQDVPITVAEVSGSDLASIGITDITDIKVAVPGVAVRQSSGFAEPYIRGVGSAAKTPLDEPPVGTYVDDVYIASQTSILTFNNIKDIEVDKGPQGTLFGRNTTGGVLNIRTVDPTSETTGGFHVGYGNYDTTSGDGYIAGSITDNLKSDLAVVGSRQGDGFGRNLTTGQDVYQNDHNYGLRSKSIYTPDDADRVVFIVDFSDEKNSLSNPSTFFPGSQLSPGVLVPVISNNRYDVENNVQGDVKSQAGGASLQLSHDFSDFTLKSISAYRYTHYHQDLDADGTAASVLAVDGTINDRQITQEFQAQSNGSGPFSWTAGIFYFSGRSTYAPNDLIIGNSLDELYNEIFHAESVAGYAQGTYALTADTRLTLGARYTYERRTIDGTITEDFASGLSLISPPGEVDRDLRVEKPSYRVALDHSLTADLMVYASYNTSFKSGGFSAINLPSYLPETLEAYEIGVKSQLFDRRVTLNAAAFDYGYKNIQVQLITPTGSFVTNGAGARIYGVDADFDVKLTSGFSVTSGLELLRAKYTSFADAPIGTPLGGGGVVSGSAAGNYLPYAPNAVANLGLVHEMSFADGVLKSSIIGYYSTKYYAQVDNFESQKAYASLNGSILWEGRSGASVKFWANNITNQIVMANATDSAPTGQHLISYEPPRTYGVTLGYKF
jgi:iron complex outermembrane recepter protein